MHNFVVKPKPAEPKDKVIDCTDDAEIVEAANLETVEFQGPIGFWYEGRFLVTAGSLRAFREWKARINV